MKRIVFLTLLSFAFMSRFALAQASGDGKQNVYVWDFTTRDLKKTDLTGKLTYDFETALAQHGQDRFRVIERRNIGRLIAQIDNERAAQSVLEISDSTIKTLKAQQADLIAFGEVFDDVDSGQLNVTVTFQAFDGTKTLIKSSLINRGLMNDATSRMGAMASLVNELVLGRAYVGREGIGNLSTPKQNSFVFSDEKYIRVRVIKVVKAEGKVVFSFLYENLSNKDYRIALYHSGKNNGTKLIDNNGEQWNMIRSYKGGEPGTDNITFSPKLPTKVMMTFEKAIGDANVVTFTFISPSHILEPTGATADPHWSNVVIKGIPVVFSN